MIYPITVFIEKHKIVSTRNYDGRVYHSFRTILEKIANCYNIKDLNTIRLTFPVYSRKGVTQYNFFNTHEIRFMDGMGNYVDLSSMKEQLMPYRYKSYYMINHSYQYRNGPVPNICKRRCYKGYYRYVRTQQEIRENELFAVNDNDLKEDYSIHIKGRKRNLPNFWDEIPVNRKNRNWKKFRKTQWK